MSLLRLLTAGKSLVGLKREAKQYRDLGPRALPKFEGKTKLFRSSPQVGTVEKDSPSTSAASQETCGSAPARPQQKPGRTSQARSWSAKWAWLWRRKTKASVPRFDKAPVQTELSLDQVKVVRNDLTDSDLEVVPVARPAAKAQETILSAKPADPVQPAAKPGEALICR